MKTNIDNILKVIFENNLETVEGINEHYARIECQAQQETQQEWIAEQEHNAGGEYE